MFYHFSIHTDKKSSYARFVKRYTFFYTTAIVLCFFYYGYSHIGKLTACTIEMARVASPNGELEIFIENRDCGATTSETKTIYLVKKNEEPSFWSSPVLRIDKFDNFNIEWVNQNQIKIKYSEARIHQFQNFWILLENSKITQNIELSLEKQD